MAAAGRRRFSGPVEDAIRTLVVERDWTAGQIYEELGRRFPEGVPHRRTVERFVAELRPPDPSGEWRPVDPGGIDPGVVVPVLRAVVDRTGGRVRTFTNERARWVERVRAAAPDLELWRTYVLARLYHLATQAERRTERLDAFVALAPWRGAAAQRHYVEVTSTIDLEILGVMPDLLNDPSQPIRFESVGEGSWNIRPGGTKTKTRAKRKGK